LNQMKYIRDMNLRQSSFLLWLLSSLFFGQPLYAQIAVTFAVRTDSLEIGEGGVHVAGEFATMGSSTIEADWDPSAPGSEMISTGIYYEVTVLFPQVAADQPFRFQFVRDNKWSNDNGDVSEGNAGDCCLDESCAVGTGGVFDRIITIPRCGGKYTCAFNRCGTWQKFSGPSLSIPDPVVPFCPGVPVNLIAISDGQIQWQADPALSCTVCPSPIVQTQTERKFYVTATKNGCSSRDSIRLEQLRLSILHPSDTLVCPGYPISLKAEGNGNINWFPASGTLCWTCFETTARTQIPAYFIATSGSGNCVLRDTVFVDMIDGPSLSLSTSRPILCKGESSSILATTSGSIQWSANPALSCFNCLNPIIHPTKTTTFVAQAEKNGCLKRDSVRVIVHEFTMATTDTVVCAGNPAELKAISNGQVNWSPVKDIACPSCEITFMQVPASIQVQVKSILGDCVIKDSVFIRVDSIQVEAGANQEILYGQSAQLTASGAPSFVWKLDPFLSCSLCANPIVVPNVSTWYYVESEKPSACQNRDSVRVAVRYDCDPVLFPTLFTPNGDEKNDRFGLNSILNGNACLLHFEEVVVFNRWGQQVFHSSDPDFGFPSGSIASGVYFYRIQFRERTWQGWAQFSSESVHN
jgi:hypothetical protein